MMLYGLLGEVKLPMSEQSDSRFSTAIAQKERLVVEAEQLTASGDFRGGHQRAQELIRQFDEAPTAGLAEPELRARFRHEIDQFYDRRRADGARRAALRDDARRRKEQLTLEAQKVATWEDVPAASREMNRLFDQWRSLPSAGRGVEEPLWKSFNEARRAVQNRGRGRHPSQPRPATDTRQRQREWLTRRVANLERIYGQIEYEISVLGSEIKNIETALYYAGGHNRASDARMNKQLLKKNEIRQRKWQRLAGIGAELGAVRDELGRLG
jgi:hypothetical protein